MLHVLNVENSEWLRVLSYLPGQHHTGNHSQTPPINSMPILLPRPYLRSCNKQDQDSGKKKSHNT
ncbi:hypothetical protein TcasGA2_TC034157 [Tribolium castaneum]|uniref:Uncharacterized protein n=1 Tax=Tribolium castaneum TaxID=7070 RepID=A0A139WCW1_TRICA|nr:hypothetical protein TcasGA2_TC034157 [Tribolium castaneum]